MAYVVEILIRDPYLTHAPRSQAVRRPAAPESIHTACQLPLLSRDPFDGRDRGAQAAEFPRRFMDGRLVGCDNQVKPPPHAAFGKLISNACRSTVTIASGRDDDMAAS